MKYAKPEVVVLASANTAIQGGKTLTQGFDNISQSESYVTVAAYQGDE